MPKPKRSRRQRRDDKARAKQYAQQLATDLVAAQAELDEAPRHLTMADLPPAVAERITFENGAPRRVRSERLPPEAREVFHELWDDIVADVYDEMAGRGRKALFDKDVINRALTRVASRMQQGERALIAAAVYAPLPGDREWQHVGVAGAGAGVGAAAEEAAAYLSAGTGATVAVASAIVAELFETYVAASARTRQYRREGRSPDPELIATDLAESLGFSGSIGRRTNSELTRSVVQYLSEKLIVRTGTRFARGLLPVMGIAVNAGTAGRNIRRVVRVPRREPSEQEVMRHAQNIVLEHEAWEEARQRFESTPGLDAAEGT